MKRKTIAFAALAALAALPVLTAFAGPPPAGGKPGGKASAAPVATEAPTLGQNLNQMYEPFKWGMNHAEVIKVHNQTGGVFDLDYNPQLAKLQPGVKMQALEAERDSKKSAFAASWVEFKDTPTGYDQTGIKDEYTYRNKESIMYVDRNARRRYFFFIGDRLWKIYDEVSFSEQSGKTFTEVVTKLNTQLGTPGRIRAADAAQGIAQTTVDWQDGSTHLRAVDRGASVYGLVFEEKATLGNLAQLRANKADDPFAVDPSISAATRGVGRSDPNAAKASASASSKPPPKR